MLVVSSLLCAHVSHWATGETATFNTMTLCGTLRTRQHTDSQRGSYSDEPRYLCLTLHSLTSSFPLHYYSLSLSLLLCLFPSLSCSTSFHPFSVSLYSGEACELSAVSVRVTQSYSSNPVEGNIQALCEPSSAEFQ